MDGSGDGTLVGRNDGLGVGITVGVTVCVEEDAAQGKQRLAFIRNTRTREIGAGDVDSHVVLGAELGAEVGLHVFIFATSVMVVESRHGSRQVSPGLPGVRVYCFNLCPHIWPGTNPVNVLFNN